MPGPVKCREKFCQDLLSFCVCVHMYACTCAPCSTQSQYVCIDTFMKHMFNIYYMPGTLEKKMNFKNFYDDSVRWPLLPHFPDEKTEAWRGGVTFPRPGHIKQVTHP